MIQKFLNADKSFDVLNELEKNKLQLVLARNEFDNVCDEAHIKAVIYRLCELETRQDWLLKQIRRGE